VIVLTKSFATEAAARSIASAVGPATWIVTLQNGLGNDRRLGAVLGPGRVVPGTTTVGAEQDAPGTARMSPSTAAGLTVTHLGPPRGSPAMPEPVTAVARLLTGAGLPAEALDDADRVIWTKLALAGPMGCLSALLRRSVLDTYEDPRARQILRDLFDEVVAVAGAHGVGLDAAATWAHAERTFRAVGPHTASMAADVLAGRPTEIDALCLEVVRLGGERGVATPVSATVGRAIRAIEATYDRALGG
jgi:2-dehydropantoate 2-reductase